MPNFSSIAGSIENTEETAVSIQSNFIFILINIFNFNLAIFVKKFTAVETLVSSFHKSPCPDFPQCIKWEDEDMMLLYPQILQRT